MWVNGDDTGDKVLYEMMVLILFFCFVFVFFCQAKDGIRGLVRSRGVEDVYKRQALARGYVRNDPATLGGNSARQPDALLQSAGEVARRVALAAMSRTFHKIATERQFFRRIGRKGDDRIRAEVEPVSYTQLTLQTIYSM